MQEREFIKEAKLWMAVTSFVHIVFITEYLFVVVLCPKNGHNQNYLNVIYKRAVRWFLFLRLNYRFGSSDMRRLCKIFCF